MERHTSMICRIAAWRRALGCLILVAAIQPTKAQVIYNPPHSIGPKKNILEWLALPPTAVFDAENTPEMEKCLTIALSLGLGGAPVIIREKGSTLMYSLLPMTIGLVATMLTLKSGRLEYRGRHKYDLELVKQCVATAPKPNRSPQ